MAERRLWLAVVYPIGNESIFGGAWDKDRLHSTRRAATDEALSMARELHLSRIRWSEISDYWMVGRCHKIGRENELYGATVRGVLPPADQS
jgi:hypothetical protein